MSEKMSKKYFLEDLHEYEGEWGGHYINARKNKHGQFFKTAEDWEKYRPGDGNTPLMIHLFNNIGIEFKYCLDIGAYSTMDSNVYPIMKRFGTEGLLIDGNNKHRDPVVVQAWIQQSNLHHILSENGCPKKLDFLSVDIDNNDYWILKTLLSEGYISNVLIFEFNPAFSIDESYVKTYHHAARKNDKHTGCSSCYGSSLRAVTNLAYEFGYRLIHTIPGENNAVFIQKRFDTKDMCANKLKMLSRLHPEPWIEKHKIKMNKERYGISTEVRHVKGNMCQYLNSEEISLLKKKMISSFVEVDSLSYKLAESTIPK